MSTEPDTVKVTVTSTWRATHTFTVPRQAYRTADVGELGSLLELIALDPEGGGDIDAGQAEITDWEVSADR